MTCTSPWRMGVDLGGSKIEAIVLDTNNTEVIRQRIATPQGDYGATLGRTVDLIKHIEQQLDAPASLGIGTPGAISPATGVIKNSNSVCLNGKPFKQDLEKALGRKVALANDADCFALSEASDGAGAGAHSVFGVILGTGAGGGIVVNGHLLHGPNAIAGEWGHNPLPWMRDDEHPGPPCYCGKHGCIETFVSGPGLSAEYQRRYHLALTARQIAAQAELGEERAEVVLQCYEDRLARALATVINIIDPQVIVLGGGVSNITRLLHSLPQCWGAYVFSDRVDTRLVTARFGDSSGVRGAAWLGASVST